MKKYIFFAFLTVRSCPRLLGEHVQKVLQKLIARIRKEKFFSIVPGKERSCLFFTKKQVSCNNFWKESPFWVKFVFPYTLFIFPPPLKFSKNHDQKQSHNYMTESGKMTHLSLWPLGVNNSNYCRHIAGLTVINSKNPSRNNLEIIDLKSWIKGKSSNISFQNFYIRKVVKAVLYWEKYVLVEIV
jgi:hypothetical protein